MENNTLPFFMKEVMDKAKQGDGDACFDVAEFFYAQKDFGNAFLWNKKASECAQPNPGAFFNLGYAYQYGEGTDVDMFAAFEAYQKASDLGVPQAMNNLAMFYETGIVVSRDLDRADELCRNATKILNNLQTELYKVKKQYTALQQEQQDMKQQLETARAAEAESKAQAMSALQQVGDLQDKLTQAKEQQKLYQQSHQQLESVKKERTELKQQLIAVNADYQVEQRKTQRFAEETGKQEQARKELEDALVSAKNQISAQSQTVENMRAASGKADEKIRNLEQKLKEAQQQISREQEKSAGLNTANEALRKQKPFMKKKNILAWLDGWFLLFYIATLLLLNVLYPSDVGFLLEVIWSLGLTILCWCLLKKKRFYWHGAVCWATCAFIMLPCLVGMEMELFSYADAIDSLIFRVLYIVAYLWLFVISFKKETIESDAG